ncbi:deuterosome assembly protein 1 isoform X2 [Mesoplodon densirostris]|uniref:deuterosome assembly protein 1 isoform X2 n=1 Tax=Mesoplodon densirostris TaxID=48708 RepID=UPI0028DB3F7E|nr:deuterosome assembly protein 1 isoform X2 [Mesoplodon densirostris]
MLQFLDMENQAHNTVGASPCEAELQELMKQIDIMVNNKKLDWERKIQALETRLDLRDQELANAQICLEQKGQEFSKLTNSFEKLRLHQMEQNKFRQKEVPRVKEEIPFELSNLNQKLEKQEQSYQTPLNSKKQGIEDSSSEIPWIWEPDTSCETNERDDFVIEKLKSAVSEIELSRNKLQYENQKLLQELKMYQRQCQAMEAELSEVKSELQSRDDLLRIIEMERLQLHRELLKVGECQSAPEDKKRLESSYSPSIKETEKQWKELFAVTPDQPNHEKELNKIRSQLYQEEEYHSSEQERMRNEISDLTEELHQKEITIATIMKKAAFLKRQLKLELEIKEKMLAKQQISGIADIKSMDFTNSEHARHTSINILEYENERLQNDFAELHASGKSAWANQNTYEETGRFSHDREPNKSATPSLPPLTFQTKEMTSPLVSDDEVFPMSPPDIAFPGSLAAQHFLLEEEKREKELEKLLNAHIDELQRETEFTLNKYTKLKQNRHI